MRKLHLAVFIVSALMFSSFTSDQLLKTSLKLNVRNELGNIEEDVKVQLYANEDDYRDETNPVGEARYTDKKGFAKFSDLEPKVYFIHAEKGDKNNVGAGVQTDKLEEGKMNKITIIIE